MGRWFPVSCIVHAGLPTRRSVRVGLRDPCYGSTMDHGLAAVRVPIATRSYEQQVAFVLDGHRSGDPAELLSDLMARNDSNS
jgi:hypothetical protein